MKLEKAIEILEIKEASDFAGITYDYEDAVKLGLEALKRIQHHREYSIAVPMFILPGETPPGDSP